MNGETWISLAQWGAGLLVGGGFMRLWTAWRKDRKEAKVDDLDLAALIRKVATDEVQTAYKQIRDLRTQYEKEIEELRQKYNKLEERDQMAMDYIVTLLTWIGGQTTVRPPAPPLGLRIPGWSK